jgi:hypothetical protein
MNQTSIVDGINIDPVIPGIFWSFIPKGSRPEDHLNWLEKPIILSVANPHFPTGVRYDVYCLEAGGTSDRPALWGMFGTLEEAVQRAKEGPPWRERVPRNSKKFSRKPYEVPGNQTNLHLSEPLGAS